MRAAPLAKRQIKHVRLQPRRIPAEITKEIHTSLQRITLSMGSRGHGVQNQDEKARSIISTNRAGSAIRPERDSRARVEKDRQLARLCAA